MVMVTVNPDEPLEKAIKRFKKKFEKAGILKDIKRTSFYLKPSEEKRMRRAKAMKRLRKALANQQKKKIY
ncbi:MAG: 30S ribosomal protein S21 [Candidatus Neomarinimicrobiota bacterium]|nr:30S ribosomal protein S21 [Candidatus Neomarinimicrobiota bacterium]MCD6099775.1 30S ribosomal protein S21 [Candidatus Neomarinimicrobiota bacterium]RKY45963.1 MAG: 30S ribosomal protein S21 [Candidatus Neomarinimicrobiota bacterium]RKY49371.1 MAG: 30S ribosomal protein S21 [Candidatus Neomarinimicrobiota bacterium]RKY52603.1 MAG: 30S ribosomal protein S21 [Candidatus Neomarinimicrobiota bacterium]